MVSETVGYVLLGPMGEFEIALLKSFLDALESFWSGKISEEDLQKVAADYRSSVWKEKAAAGIEYIPSNLFTLCDRVLDTTSMLGAVPPRYGWYSGEIGLDVYFLMARGNAHYPAMEMTKWFDTNYHYIVPELGPDVNFSYASHKAVTEYKEAKALGIDTVPVLFGPVSYLLLSKPAKGVEATFSLLSLLGKILPIYKEVVSELKEAGASWIQFDEPTLVLELDHQILRAFTEAYSELTSCLSGVNVVIETCSAGVSAEAYEALTSLNGVTGFGFDFNRGNKTLGLFEGGSPTVQCLSDASCASVPVGKSKDFCTGKIKADQSIQHFSHQAFGQGYEPYPGVIPQPFPGHGPSQRNDWGKRSLMGSALRGAVGGLAHGLAREAVMALFQGF